MGWIIEGNVVDVVSGRIFPGRIVHERGVIVSVDRSAGACPGYLVPGFIDAHIHIDSSLLCPSRFAEAVVPRGTTAVVTDPHEIGNVLGLPGIDWMREDAAAAPLRVRFTAPSCVPATPFETSGAAIGPPEVARLLAREDVVALGEVMDFPGAVAGDPDLLAKIAAARKAGKPVDGHCPLLTGERLAAYAALGISTEHECTSAAEALEKHALGIRIMVREGSAARNLADLAPFARNHEFLLVSDDRIAPDLLGGHVDRLLARCVSLGIHPIHALRAATARPARHYRLPLGVLEPGRWADVVRVRDLSEFEPLEVFVGGERVASGGEPGFSASPRPPRGKIAVAPRRAEDFVVPAGGSRVRARVIRLVPDEILTEHGIETMQASGGRLVPDVGRDLLLISLVNRYRDAPVATAVVSGFGLREGAIASSIAHDSHNLLVVGSGTEEMARAVNLLLASSGGLAAVGGGETTLLPLPAGGLMSVDPPGEVVRRHGSLLRHAAGLGCRLGRPFLSLSFLSLLVVPRLKLGDRGLFDGDAFRFVSPLVEGG